MRLWRAVTVAASSVLLIPSVAVAQSRYPFSIQGSGLYARVLGDAYEAIDLLNGYGFEVQGRWTPGALSFGAGYQRTNHAADTGDWTLSGIFIEPRFVIDVKSDRFAPYVSGRFSVLHLDGTQDAVSSSTSGVNLNVGGGLLVSLGQAGGGRANLDLGATYGYTRFGDLTLAQDGGAETLESLGSGKNIVIRIGFVIGLGK
jgi:hypothetical protein